MTKHSWPKVRRRQVKVKGHTYNYWTVDCGVIDGSRKTFTFRNEKEALLKAKRLRIERNKIGNDALRLTDKQKQESVKAYHLLNGSGSLLEAVEFFLSHTSPDGGQIVLSELLEIYLRAKERAGRRPNTLQNIKARIGFLAKEFGDIPIHKVTTYDLEKWLDKNQISGTNRDNYRRVLVSLFEFARKRKHIKSNPAADLEKPIIDEKLPEIFTVEEVKRLLAAAKKYRSDMVPYFALCLFAGLRPSEANNFSLDQIDFKSKLIAVRPAVAKKRRQRFVDMSDNLVEWLTPYKSMAAYFSRKGLELVRENAKVNWAPDILRHTYASYHIAMYEDATKTAHQMGHLRPDVLFNHYRNLVLPKDAKKFWAIRPAK